jgi:hypothetical protein
MSKFKVMIVKKNGEPVGVRAAEINGRVIVLSLKNAATRKNWYEAMEYSIPTKHEWMAIDENLEAVNKALVKAGGDPIEKYKYYWSSSEYDRYRAWNFCTHNGASQGGVDWNLKGLNDNDYVVRPVLASF